MSKNHEDMSVPRLIVKTLMTGDPLTTPTIADRVSDAAGRDIPLNNIAPALSRVCNKRKCDLALFIHKRRKGKALVYQMVDEAAALSEDQAYGLTLKTGKSAFPLEAATEMYPGLMKYVPKPRIKAMQKTQQKRPAKKAAMRRTGGVAWEPPALKTLSGAAPPSDQALNIEVTVTVTLGD